MKASDTFDIDRVRADFPILSMRIGDKPLVYLDNAASAQMPQQVIDRITIAPVREALARAIGQRIRRLS